MFTNLATLDPLKLQELATALISGRIDWPSPPDFALAPILATSQLKTATEVLTRLGHEGFSARQAGLLLQAMAVGQTSKQGPALDLVWTGPDMPFDEGRATLPVVAELFLQARKRILITGYALFDGKKIFEPLVRQLEEYPNLEVLLILNISRKPADASDDSGVVSRWARDFLKFHWKSPHIPKVYYDPRSLRQDKKERAVMHAKCIVIDGKKALISSANLTEAAQRRNIEAGLFISDEVIARKVEEKFQALIQGEHLLAVQL